MRRAVAEGNSFFGLVNGYQNPRINGAEAVLKLRSLKASGDFTDYWRFHEEQEFIRNHKSKYKKPSVINKLHIKKV